MRDISGMTLHEFIQKHSPGTQAEFAQKIGISRSYLAEILLGTKLPGRRTIEKIETATMGRVPSHVWFSGAKAEGAQP
ncbi:helix-turn-helix transcriptional regulator [Xinfangfangia sp. D13-10-4-6]|uniref:helix-turn-helix domain-containing protein n=1 Tax=Pseudogemmobacter hezensis TaxID=2737662 RepID=UPI0015539F69|nr:helix-turn-helix transcriptional regulator [Pseudogemmobacter hezensis]NPD17566.1 helix-turn-helix transcriptional regulator [Pseudogemmobacter hezensis]